MLTPSDIENGTYGHEDRALCRLFLALRFGVCPKCFALGEAKLPDPTLCCPACGFGFEAAAVEYISQKLPEFLDDYFVDDFRILHRFTK